MTYQLAALRFRSVGERSARFTDLTLNLTAPGGDGLAPQDSVIWLRNGGGKSSILSLLYALLLPRASDFMGRSVQRSLTDYIDSGDTAHVVAAWQPTQAARTLLGETEGLLITGVVHEWDDLHRPVQAAQTRDRLNSIFYAFHAVPGVLGLASLPFTDAAGRPRRLTNFVQVLREMARPFPRADLVVADSQHKWAVALADRHLDPALFRTQKQMNHVEGGVEDLFKFPAAKDFINFLLDLTTQPDAPASVAKRLASVANTLAAKPRKIMERDFCTAAASNLDEVAVRHEQAHTATEELAEARHGARALATSFAAAVQAAQDEQRSLQEQYDSLGQARTAANSERSQANDLLYLYRREAARLRVAEAKAEEETAAGNAEKATEHARAWDLVEQVAAQVDLKRTLAQAEADAAAEEKELAPLREEHARHACKLRLRLHALAEAADLAVQEAESQQRAAAETAQREQDLADQALKEQREATAYEASAEAKLEALGARRREGVKRGHLPAETTSPQEHLAAVEAERGNIQQELKALDDKADWRRDRRARLASRNTVLAGQHSTADADRRAAAERRAALGGLLAALTATARLRDLVEATPEDPVDLWAEASMLDRRLGDAVMAADDERVLRRAEQHADQRTIASQERTQLLPSSLDAERVVHELTDAGFTAQTGWMYPRAVIPADQLVTFLDDPWVARLGCGAVVSTGTIADAVRLLDNRDIATTSLVGLYSAEAADELVRSGGPGELNSGAPAWTGLQRGLVDPAAAEAAVRLLKERALAHQLKDKELKRQRDSDDELRRKISQFLMDCPAGHLDSLDTEIDALDSKLATIEEELKANGAELQALDEADQLSRATRETAEKKLRELHGRITWLEDLISALATEPTLTQQLSDAQSRATAAGERASKHAGLSREASILAAQLGETAKAERHKAQVYRSDSAEIPDTAPGADADLADDLSVPLDSLRRAQREALTAWEARASQSVLADRLRTLSQRLAEAEQKLELRPAEDRGAAERLLTSRDGQEPHLRAAALERARQAQTDAAAARGAAHSLVAQREKEAQEIEQRNAKPPRRTLPTLPATSAQADELASEQEELSQRSKDRVLEAETLMGDAEKQTARVQAREQLFSALLESLPHSADGDPEPQAAPFADTDKSARDQARYARDAISSAEGKAHAAQAELLAAVTRLHRTAGQFAGISGPMKDRVINDPPEILGHHALDLASKLRLRAQTLEGELESIAKDQLILSEALAHLVRDSFDMLGKAERGSQMNTTSGSWAGKKILRISFDRPSDADLVTYAERLIEKTIQDGLNPEGMPLLKAAVHEAAGPRGFTAKVLKPTDDETGTTEDISRLAKWSGGEKLTVCVALYCILASLRAAHTGRSGRSGGVLLLDNPIGRASAASLVRLQRDVAASHGVQLIYTTGVKDPAAVIQFPNVIRLDNREGRTHNRRYIIPDTSEDTGATVTGIRAAHTDHPWDTANNPKQQAG